MLEFHTQILRMDGREDARVSAEVVSGDDLRLTNRLNESRSPYVSAVYEGGNDAGMASGLMGSTYRFAAI